MKINLSSCTLFCADNKNNINYILNSVLSNIQFESIIIERNIQSIKEYNYFIVKKLNKLIKTDHCMIIQHDGYPLNYSAWDCRWLSLDYIGAPWINYPWSRELSVGNGGFSLRSKRLLDRISEFNYNGEEPEDAFICRTKAPVLKKEGYKFATIEDAYNFSIENTYYKGQFGFHGKGTIFMNIKAGIFR